MNMLSYDVFTDELLSFLASSGASHRIAVIDDETAAIEGAMTTALRRVRTLILWALLVLPFCVCSTMKMSSCTLAVLQQHPVKLGRKKRKNHLNHLLGLHLHLTSITMAILSFLATRLLHVQ